MKFMRTSVVYLVIVLVLSLARAQAAVPKTTILTDKEMAAIQGGFCLIEICETGQPTGNCQVLPPNNLGVCPNGTCRFVRTNTIPPIEGCTLFGQYTCTAPKGYRKCIQGRLWDICVYSTVNVCGNIYEPFCTENIKEHTCVCGSRELGEPCDWTNCVP